MPREPLPLVEILSRTGGDFCVAYYDHLVAKLAEHRPLEPLEHEAYLLLTMLLRIEMEGFVDLFVQLYTLKECSVVRATLTRLGLHRLESLFGEAFGIYTSRRTDITEEEYRDIDPFGQGPEWERFDAIGEEVLAEGSEIYLIPDRVEAYIKAKAGQHPS